MRSFIYTRHRPFHPRRLWVLLRDKFILQLEHPDDDDDEDKEDEEEYERNERDVDMIDSPAAEDTPSDAEQDAEDASPGPRSRSLTSSSSSSHSTTQTVPSPASSSKKTRQVSERPDEEMSSASSADMSAPPDDVILSTKRQHPVLARLFRSKGEFFLATRPHRAGEWSQAGAMLTMSGGRPWFCTLAPEEYTTGDAEVDGLVQHDIAKGGEWGDRRQELVFIGERLDHVALEAMLDECLLSDAEFGEWEEVMRDARLDGGEKREALEDIFEDGFPAWSEEDDEDKEGDDHAGHDHSRRHGLRAGSKQKA